MEKLFVYADFDWLGKAELLGELSFDKIRGGETYCFEFDRNWLKSYGEVFLGEDLQNFPGKQFTMPDKEIFGCFSDALPDRWGRTLLARREQLEAQRECRTARKLSSFDLLCGIDDNSRMGALRFATKQGGRFINSEESFRVPPITGVRSLMQAAQEIEHSEEMHLLPSEKWINQLIHPGTSLGGARPKSSVIDDSGRLTVAKFPSRQDNYDVGLWEHFAHVMARKAKINVAETETVPGEKYHILLSRRFDRTPGGQRIHFASALTLLGLKDGDNATNGYGYTDIVDFILRHGTDVEQNLEEIFRRVVFNIIIGNSDDHFRNHGFLLNHRGWFLSPAYDLNPTLATRQSLLINRDSDKACLETLLASCEDYMLPKPKAEKIISEVKSAMSGWEREAIKLGLPQRDIDMFAPRFNKSIQ